MTSFYGFDRTPLSLEECSCASSTDLITWLEDIKDALTEDSQNWELNFSKTSIHLEMRRRVRKEEEGYIGHDGCKETFSKYIVL